MVIRSWSLLLWLYMVYFSPCSFREISQWNNKHLRHLHQGQTFTFWTVCSDKNFVVARLDPPLHLITIWEISAQTYCCLLTWLHSLFKSRPCRHWNMHMHCSSPAIKLWHNITKPSVTFQKWTVCNGWHLPLLAILLRTYFHWSCLIVSCLDILDMIPLLWWGKHPIWASILIPVVPCWLPTNGPQRVAEAGPSAWALVIHEGDSKEALGLLLWPGPALAIAAISGVD